MRLFSQDRNADPDGIHADVAGDAAGKSAIEGRMSGKGLLHCRQPGSFVLDMSEGSGGADAYTRCGHVMKAVADIRRDGVKHPVFCLLHSPGFGKGIKLPSLDREHRL